MLPFTCRRDGHYDENGDWQREKYCFVSCEERCTCTPPNGIWHIDVTEKDDDENSEETNAT